MAKAPVAGVLLVAVRAALLLVALGTQFALALPGMLSPPGPRGGEPVAFALLALVGLGVGWSLARFGRVSPRGRWIGVAVVTAAALLVAADAPLGPVLRGEHWFTGLVGWFWLALLFDLPLALLACFLAAPVLAGLAGAFAAGAPLAEVAAFAAWGVSVVGFQFAVGASAALARRIALRAKAVARVEEELLVREAAAEQVHRDRRRRHADLLDTAVPLLTGLADGSLDPADEAVRRRCAVESARVRRLLAEGDGAADPLVHELRAGIDTAVRRGVEVHLVVRGQVRDVPREVRRGLLDPVVEVLATVSSEARATVLRVGDRVRVSVVGDAPDPPGRDRPPERACDGPVDVTRVRRGESLWVETSWRRAG